jgi:hypothetical protein
MVERHNGVQSYLIAKSSLEQVGYKPAPGTPAGARLNGWALIEAPRSPSGDGKKIGSPKKNFKGERKIFWRVTPRKIQGRHKPLERMLETQLTETERLFVERRLSEERATLQNLQAETFPIAFRMPQARPEPSSAQQWGDAW